MEYCYVKLYLQDVKSLELRFSPEKDEWKHQLLFRLDSCCFKRWLYTNTKLKKKKKTLEHNELLLFRYASNISAFSGPEQKSGKTQPLARNSGDLPCTPSSFLSLLRTERSSSTETKVCTEFTVLFVPVVRFQTRPKWIARMTK